MTWYLFVEGGGDSRELQTLLRRAFSNLLERLELPSMPRIRACGGRQETERDFRLARQQGKTALLLVDADGPMPASPGENEHYMVQAMEAWIVSQPEVLRAHFGDCFGEVGERRDIEQIAVAQVLEIMARGARKCSKKYQKRKDGAALVALLEPDGLAALPAAARFFARVEELARTTP